MSEQMLSFCGIDCSVCPAYIATQAEDIGKLTYLAGEWFDGLTDYTSILCDGCSGEGRIMKWCSECPTRACAIVCGVENSLTAMITAVKNCSKFSRCLMSRVRIWSVFEQRSNP